ncbi:hypothetical protein STEG23_013704 [Scotinomys teguina]
MLPLWRLIRYCLKEGKCVDILHEGRRALSAHQDSMSESDNKEKGNLKEERPKSNKASSKLCTKVEKEKKTDQGKKEKETDQGKAKQKPSGLYPVLDEFSDLTLSDSAEDELESKEEEDLEEAAAAYERERYEDAGNESRRMASYLAGNWTRDIELLMSQQLLQIAALNKTRV